MTRTNEDLIKELQTLQEENQSLRLDNDFLDRQNRALKLRCGKYCLENHELHKKIADMEFTSRLLGEPMTESDIAEEQFIENGEAHYEKTWNLACEGDDF